MIRFLCAILFLVSLLGGGCASRDDKPITKTEETPKNVVPVRRIELNEARQVMEKLKLAQERYFAEHPEHPEPPQKWQDFAIHYDNIERINLILQNEWIKFVWGVSKEKLADHPKAILAYESQEGPEGKRVVLLADGTIADLDRATFEKTPKMQGN